MKKILLNFLLGLGLIQVSNAAFAQAPTVSYPTANNYTVGASIGTLSPASANVATYAYGPGVLFTGGTLSNPYGMAFDGSGNVIVANYTSDNVLKYSAAGAYSSIYITKANIQSGPGGAIKQPTSVGFDASLNPYVSFKAGYTYQFTTAGAYNAQVTSTPANMDGMFIDANSNIWLADFNDKAVYEYSTAGALLLTIPASANLSGPVNVAVDGLGNIYILDQTNKDVLKYSSAGTYLSTPVTGLSTTAWGLNIDKSGNIYVGDTGNTDVNVYPPVGGTAIATISSSGAADARGVLPDAKGNLYVSNYTGSTITKYPPVGGYYLTSGILPAGLVFDSKTGNITGTPTAAYSGNYTVTAYNSAGTAVTSVSFPIVVTYAKPTVTYTIPTAPPYNFASGQAITVGASPTPTTTGTINTTGTIFVITNTSTLVTGSAGLPTGMAFSNITGVINGTPTGGASTGTYTVTVTGPGGTSTAFGPFTINVVLPPAFSYTTPYQPITGVPMSIAPTVTAGSPTTWTATNLPAGLTINAGTGVISGTSTAAANNTVVVKATNALGFSTSINIVINKPISPAGFSYTSPGPYTQNLAISSLTPTATISNATISPAMPTGLSISAAGVITGTPTVVSASTVYMVTALIGAVYESATVTLSVVAPAAPVLSYSGTPYNFTQNITNTTVPIANAGGAVVSSYTFTLTSGALPAGITFSTTTGTFTCAPTTIGSFTGTVNGSNSVGVSSTTPASITINVTGATAPNLSYSPNTYTVTYGTAINATIINSGSAVTSTYTLASGTLPAGLSLNAATGAITGVSSVTTVATVTVTGSNTAGAATQNASLTITVNPASLTITATGPLKAYGTAIAGGSSTTNFTTSGTVNSETVSGVTLTPDPNGASATTTAGSPYVINASTATGGGTFLTSNYTITYVPYNGTVSSAALTITATGVSKVFGTTLTGASGSTAFTPTGLQNGESVGTVAIAYGVASAVTANVGAYATQVTPSAAIGGTFTASNYTITYVGGTITVTAAPLTITANNQTRTFGTPFTFAGTEFSISGLQNSDNVTNATITSTGSVATANVAGSPYPIVANAPLTGNGSFVASNYSITYVNGTMTVNPALLTITAATNNKTYGTTLTGGSGSTAFTSTGLQNGNTIGSVTIGYGTGSAANAAVATYTSQITISAATGGTFIASNYTTSYVQGNIVVGPAALTISASGVSKLYGTTLTGGAGSTAFTPTGLQNGETVGSVTIAYGAAASAGTAVGVYAGEVTASAAAGGSFAAGDYTITYVAGTITVTAAPPDFSYTPAPTYLVGTAITAITPTTLGGSAVAGLTYTTPGTALTNTNLSGAWGMASDPAGDIYIANYNTGKVTEYGPTGTYLGVVINIGLTNSLASIAIDGSGNIYLGTAGGAIYKYNNLFVAQTYTTSTTPNSAYGMTTDAAGDLYVADEVGGFVDEYSPTGALLLKLSYDAGGASGRIFDPNDVQVDAAGNIYVLDGNYNDITEYTSTGAYLGKPITGLSNFDYNFYIDPSGNFDVSNTGGGNIKIYSSGGGAAITTLTPTSGTKPRGIFVDGSGNLYQVDNTGNVLYKYAPAGGYTLNYVSGTTSLPPGLTFNSTTGAISGTPTIAFTGTYSVTGINAGGSFTCTSFTINCVSKPIIIYTTPDSYLVSGTSIAPITPTNTGSPVSGAGTYVYAITSGAVPSGWTFTAATGVITGTPALADVGTYTITVTATNAYGTSAPFTLTINVVTPPVLTYPTPSYYAVNQAITTLSATNTGGTIPALQTYGTGAVILNSSSNGLNEPMGMAVDVSGNLYVTNFGANSVTEYSTTGTVTTYATGVPNGPVGIVFDSSGNVYVLGQTARDVVRFAGGISGAAAGIITTGLNTPTGISIDASGNLYVANSGTNTIKKYSVSGTTATLTLTYTASNFEDIYGNTLTVTGGVSVDNSGNVWFASYTAGITYLAEFNPAGNELFTAPGLGTTRNYGVYLDGGGNVFLTGTGTNNGEILNGNTLAATADETGFTTPEGIVSDGLGNFYISDYGAGTVTKYSPQMGYYLSGTLPPGLSFNNTNGQITGTPTAAYTGNFTVTGYIDGFSATSNTFQINCGYAPIISYITPDDFLINTAITALNPTNVSNPATGTWSVSPALPAGLTLNPSTGVIYGTPNALSPATNYIVSVGNIYGTGGGTLNITVYSAPAFSYVPDPDNLPINVAMASLLPTTAAGVGSPIPNTTTPYNTTGVAFKTGLGANIPWGIASDASGNIYVANNTGNTIIKYSPGGAVMGTYTTTAAVSGVTVDPYGNVYAILTTGYIYKYSTTVFGAGTLLTNAIYLLDYTYNSVSADYGITSDPSGNLYISDATTTPNPGTTSPPAIWKYTLGTGSMAVLVTKGTTGLSKPSGVAVDATGNVYSLDLGTKELVKYNSSGTYVSALPTGLNTPYGLYIDALGHIFIGDSGTSTVKEWNSTGTTVIQAIATGTPASPRGITEDPFYNLYVTDYTNGTVTKYLPNLYEITTAGALPTGLSFNTNTGTFSGTPTVVQGPLTYNIVAYGLGSSSGSSPETFNCYTSFDWIGPITAANTNWNTAANWESLVVPVAGNTANFGVNIAFTNQPTVTANATVGAIQIGNSGGKALTLTVSSGITLTVNTTSGGTGAITKQSDANSLAAFATGSSLAGAGTITAVNLDVIGSTVLTSNYTETFSSAVTSLKLSGTVNLASGFSTNAENATFNVTGGITSVTAALATSNAAGATSTFGVVPTTAGTLQLANSTPLSGLSATGTNVTNFKNAGATIEYSGAAQTFCTDAAVANLSNTVSYQSIKFSGTGVKSPTSGNLNVAGDFTNAMANDATDYVTLTSTPVYFNGAGAQNINAGGGTGTVFNNITFNGSGATTIQSGMAYVDDVGTLTMAGTSTLAAGGFLTLNSDATGTAAIAPITSGTPISGTVNVQRYITGDRSYRLMSSPVSAGTSPNGAASMNYLLNSLYLTGPGTGFTATGNPTLFLYDESFVPQYSTFYNSNYIAVNSMTSGTGTTPTYLMYANGTTAANGLVSASTGYTVPAGNGYYVFYRGNPATEGSTAGVPNVTNPAYTPVLSDVATASGTLNQGQVTFMQWYNPTSTTFGGLSQYWTLIGNPYASAIDLAQVQGTTTSSGIFMTPYNSGTNTGITSFIYELQPANGIYAIYNTAGPSTLHASEFIGSGQGFMIEAYGANSSQVVFNENAKATSTNSSLPQGFMNRRITNLAAINPGVPNPILRLRMTKDSINDEETIITFNPKSSSGFVINEDARHWKGEGLIGFTSISSDNVPLAINSLPLAATQTIPLRTVATNDGLYNISLAQQAPLPALYEIWLKDAYMKDSLDIKDNPSYNFDIAHADTASYGDYRFSLVIRQNAALMVHLLSFTALKATGGDNVAWTTENEANYTNFAVQRSTDGGTTFGTLGTLASSGLGAYSYLDSKPVQGANSYRLQLTDLNGTVTYSNIITIMYANTDNQIALNGFMVYPNPTAGAFNLSITQPTTNANATASATVSTNYTIQIVNNLGVVLKTAQSSSPQWQTDVSSLNPGTYFITVMNSSTNKVVGKSAFVKL